MARKKLAKESGGRRTSAKRAATPVESIRHQDTRKNIPTEELRDFVTEDEYAPRARLYPRDPSLDPQLVWKGKDEQDRSDLSVPVVPIYIQEKIHPQAIIDALPRIERSGGQQLDFFADFNGLENDFDRKVEFYQHDQHWQNRMILGDSLLVMTSLAEKEGLKGKVQTIYFDPPYGIKFGSNWQVSTRKRDVKDGKAEDATRQPEQVRAFRDTWKLGIHSYLAYLRDRLVAARELLTETGSVFVQIGDENVHLVRAVMDEVFGPENFVACINFQSMTPLESGHIENVFDYIVWYSKNKPTLKYRNLYVPKPLIGNSEFRYFQLSDRTHRELTSDELDNVDRMEMGSVFKRSALESSGFTPSCVFPFKFNGVEFLPRGGKSWRTNKNGMDALQRADRFFVAGSKLYFKLFHADFGYTSMVNTWSDTVGGFSETKRYVVQTLPKIVQRCLLMTTDPGDLVLDPTCGSGTTAYVAEQWGRRWITCDTSRVALALARTRLMAAKFPYYYLADDYPTWTQHVADDELKTYLRKTPPASDPKIGPDIHKGFVYKRVPHVTLKSIANNPDIKEGMSRVEIDAAIARHAETETLFDQPYEDNKRVRVSGPFTVESLSPHRTISAEEKRQRSEHWKESRSLKTIGPDQFGQMIIDNLRKAGVQNTKKKERLKFDSLEPYVGEWIHAEGHFTEADGTQKRAAICIGPEHGTVGTLLVKEAAKEAVKGVGFDMLIICGFAFDPSVSEEVKRYGKLTVLPTRMNPDLAMGDELLKKTGAGNLFTVFGEPDVEIKKQQDGQLVAQINGLDVYDPTTGEIRSSSTDDIACWFIDTAYNGESFFVRHAYFTGADEPYEKLKRALRAEIDEAAWSGLYSTVSRPFPKPDTSKIAVKVINHYGDEVLKVYEV